MAIPTVSIATARIQSTPLPPTKATAKPTTNTTTKSVRRSTRTRTPTQPSLKDMIDKQSTGKQKQPTRTKGAVERPEQLTTSTGGTSDDVTIVAVKEVSDFFLSPKERSERALANRIAKNKETSLKSAMAEKQIFQGKEEHPFFKRTRSSAGNTASASAALADCTSTLERSLSSTALKLHCQPLPEFPHLSHTCVWNQSELQALQSIYDHAPTTTELHACNTTTMADTTCSRHDRDRFQSIDCNFASLLQQQQPLRRAPCIATPCTSASGCEFTVDSALAALVERHPDKAVLLQQCYQTLEADDPSSLPESQSILDESLWTKYVSMCHNVAYLHTTCQHLAQLKPGNALLLLYVTHLVPAYHASLYCRRHSPCDCTYISNRGPVGSGKTSSLYGACRMLGKSVLETNAGHDRRGKTIATKYEEATQSHRVTNTKESALLVGKLPFSPPIIVIESDQTLEEQQLATLQQQQQQPSEVVLLFEEIDIDLGIDNGFTSALHNLIANSKRPIVLTANRM
jgi:hypothetical protein